MVEAAAKIAAMRGAGIEARGLRHVARDNPAVLMEAAEEVDRLGIAQPRCLFEPIERRRLVLRHALAEREQGGVIVHRPVEPLFGGEAEAFRRAVLHHRRAPAEIVAAPDHVERHHMMLRRGALEPVERSRRIARDAIPVEQHLAVDCLRLGKPRLCRSTNKRRPLGRRRGEAGGDLVRAEREESLPQNVTSTVPNTVRPGAIVA